MLADPRRSESGFSWHRDDGVAESADEGRGVGERDHLPGECLWHDQRVARRKPHGLLLDGDCELSAGHVPDLLGVDGVGGVALTLAHVDLPHAEHARVTLCRGRERGHDGVLGLGASGGASAIGSYGHGRSWLGSGWLLVAVGANARVDASGEALAGASWRRGGARR